MSKTKRQANPLYHWRKLNETKGWTQRKVAAHTKVNRITVHRFETYRRRPSEDTAALIASLPGFPLTKDEILRDFKKNVIGGTR